MIWTVKLLLNNENITKKMKQVQFNYFVISLLRCISCTHSCVIKPAHSNTVSIHLLMNWMFDFGESGMSCNLKFDLQISIAWLIQMDQENVLKIILYYNTFNSSINCEFVVITMVRWFVVNEQWLVCRKPCWTHKAIATVQLKIIW